MQTARPALPGLVKIFLVQSYIWVATLFPVYMIFSIAQQEIGFEAACWGVAFLGLALAATASIVGIHTRAPWAPGACRAFCVAGLLLIAAGIIRILIGMDGMRFYLDDLVYAMRSGGAVLIPASILMWIPLLIAWHRYFAGAPSVRAAFGRPDEPSALPPLGVGLLQLLCWMFLLVNAGLFLTLAAADVSAGPGFLPSILVLSVPNLLFPAVLLILLRKPGARLLPLLLTVCAWIAVAAAWNNAMAYLVSDFFKQDIGFTYRFMPWVRLLPVSPMVFACLAAALCWRFATATEEGAWVRQDDGLAATIRACRQPLVALLTLYLAYTWLQQGAKVIPGIVHNVKDIPVYVVVFPVCALLLAAAGVFFAVSRLRAEQDEPGRGVMVFFALSLCFLAIAAVSYFLEARGRGQHGYLFRYMIPQYLVLAGLYIFGILSVARGHALARDGIRDASLHAMPVPAGCFALFALTVLASELLPMALTLVGSLWEPDIANVRFVNDGEGGLWKSLLNPNFWIGWVICPLIAVTMLKRGLPSLGRFYVLGVVWVMALFTNQAQMLAGSLFSRRYSDFIVFPSPRAQAAAVLVIIFLMYLSSSREIAAWRAWRGYARNA